MKKENIKPLFESRYINIYDLEYEPGKHYYNASRRKCDDLPVIKNDEEFRSMTADAVTCIVIIKENGKEPKLLLAREYRYPTGQFLLSPPAGLIDPADKEKEDPLTVTAIREIHEETGIVMGAGDRVEVINPLLFSSPGMTDESNALVLAVVDLPDLRSLNQDGAEGTELFDGFVLLDRNEALEILKKGRDSEDVFYSVYTWAALMYFVSDLYMV